MTIKSRTENLEKVRKFVADAAAKFGFDKEAVSNIVLAVDEACTNVIRHAYANAPDKEIWIAIDLKNGRFEVKVADTGRSFDPDTVPPPNVREFLRQGKTGGFGIYLMRRMVDEVHFSSLPGKRNEALLVKYLQPLAQANR
jgi:serine/threonine-protein kinase RsbW